MTESGGHILVVDDEPDMLETCRRILTRRGHTVETAASADAAERILAEARIDLLIADVVMPGRDGLELSRLARRRDDHLAVLIITAHANVESAMRATRDGACDYIPKPFTMEQLELAVDRALELRRLRGENFALRQQLDGQFDLPNIVGASPGMHDVLAVIRKVSQTDANVLITGESGTGKELVARAIHANSRRRARQFVPIDCAALPETLLESELFGAARGAYTGADGTRTGLIESADAGTLFLDEIGNLPIPVQVKLLRVIEERAIRRLGTTRQIAVDVRIVAATNKDLQGLTREGLFREDLFYRLNVVQITIPPLRERPGDVRLLAQRFVDEIAARAGKAVRGVSAAALMLLERYPWPGNARELRNVIERAVSLTDSNQVMPCDLPSDIGEPSAAAARAGAFPSAKARAISTFEAAYLRDLLERAGGNVSRAAAHAGLKRTALHRLLARHGLRAEDFRRNGRRGGA